MKINLEVKVANNGLMHLYPVDEKGFTLIKITKTKTLTPETIKLFKQLGFTFLIGEKEL